jgi:hypothetical protein
MAAQDRVVSAFLGLIGAVVGGALGFFAFGWALRQGFYAMILPGGLLGIGCALLSREHSFPRGIACGVAALALGLFSEWKYRPFAADERFAYFLSHMNKLDAPGITYLMIGLGALMAVWIGKDAGLRRIFPPPTGSK